MDKISILLTNRNTLNFLKLAIKSIRKNASNKFHELIIMDDGSNDGSKEWLKENRNKYNYSYHTHDDIQRKGIVNVVEEGIKLCNKDIIFNAHSDMYFGKNFDKQLIRHLKPKTIVSATRIEPPIHPPENCKIIRDFGFFPKDFKEKEFNEFVEEAKIEFKTRTTKGIFVPYMFYKKDWVGYDKDFIPQSHEDSDLFWRWLQEKYEFIQSWGSFVYHFTCRGSRYQDETLTDSDEWKKSNAKNLKNFIRKWGSTPIYNLNKHPLLSSDIKLTASVLMKNEGDKIYTFLEYMEPYFNEIIIADDYSTDNSLTEIERYIQDTLKKGPTNFRKDKIKIFKRKLDMDFATQTNEITKRATNNWIMKLDPDELMDDRSLNNIRFLLSAMEKENPLVEVIAIPRINTLNGVLVNDISRENWSKEYLSTLKQFNPKDPLTLKNPDYQFRFFKKNVKWVNKVHEQPEPVKNNEKGKVMITHNMALFHPKTVQKQNNQNEFYNKIIKKDETGNIKNVVVNSVIYTFEGITKHPREEMKELKKLGYNIFITSQPYQSGFDEEMKKMYDIFDTKKPHITYINQPPIRENNSFMSILGNLNKPNLVAYLSFEGLIPQQWTDVLNYSNVKMIFVPSNYVKDCFVKSGIKDKDKIKVIPHGINPDSIKNIKPHEFDKFTFLFAGTTHNMRKGYDLAIKAFSEEFKEEKDVQLVLKVNKIYNPNQDIGREINKYVVEGGNKNIHYIDDNLSDEELYSLLKGANAYISPHRSEGYGIFILESLALGTPTIATSASGNMDFCNKDNTFLIGVKDRLSWAPFRFPYERTKWFQPKISDLKKHMRYIYENYEKCRDNSIKESNKILKKWTWENTAKLMDKAFKEL